MSVAWPDNINTKIRRNGTDWSDVCGFISDTTRSGKQKRRLAHSQGKRPFSVKMIFNLLEYSYFTNWYKTICRYGFYSFNFPKIDASGSSYAEYRFQKDTYPKYSNISGKMIECTMSWEEV